MRNRFFYNNNQAQAKRVRKSLKQKWTKAVCIGTLSAAMITGVPVIPPISAYTQEVYAAVSENAKIYKLSDPSLVTTKTITDFYGNKTAVSYIDITITEDGTYTITGSNKVDGKDIDVHISVGKGVKANIVLDNLEVKNLGLYQMDMAGAVGADSRETLFPFMDIEGTVNLYLKGNNTITMPRTMSNGTAKNVGTVFKLYGQLTVRQAEGESAASLTANNTKCLINADCYGRYEYSNGTFLMESGVVKASGASIYGVDRFFMTGGTISCDAVSTKTKSQYCFMGGEINAGFSIPNARVGEMRGTSSFDSGKAVDDCGYEMVNMSVYGLPAEAKVSSINGCPVYFTETAEDGSLTAYFRKGSNVIEIDHTFYLYEYEWSTGMLHLVSDAELCNVQFVSGEGENETTYRNIKVKKGVAMAKLFHDTHYTYTYTTEEGAVFSEATVVDKDLKVIMNSSVRTYNVKIDGESQKMEYGTPLPEGKIYYSARNRCCYYGGSPVAEDMDLTSLELITDNEGVEYAEISSKKDLMLFYNILKSDDRVNGRLTQDIDVENGEVSVNLQTYRGIFEGNGHTISNMKNEMSAGGFCRTLKGIVRNVCFENISASTYGVGGSYGAAGIVCSINRGLIQNCQVVDNKMGVIRNSWTEPAAIEPVGTVAGINMGVIKDCYAAKNSVDTTQIFQEDDKSKILYPIAKNYGVIENCYYEAETEQEAEASDEHAGIGKTQASFASGEVCYLLNQKVSDGTQVWYQNLSGQNADAYPVLKKNDNSTVYYGYEKCARIYTNQKDTKAVHSFTYMAKDDTITAVCEWNPLHQAKEVVKAQSAVYDKKEHAAVVEHSDSWAEYDQLQAGTIQYLRDGKVTTDLVSAGTITAVLRHGNVQASVEYTISKAVLPEDVPKCRHNLDKVTAAAATEVQEGNKEYYICKDCGKLFEDAQGMFEITNESTVIPKLEKNSQVSETPKPTETPKHTETPKPTETPKLTKIPEDTAASVQILPALIQPIVSQKRKQIINWKKVKGADGYFVYASRCNDKKDIRKLQRIAIISSPGKTSYVNRKLKKNTGYKYEVRAYRIRNGKKIVVGRSLQLHAFTKGSKTYDNPAGVRISGNGKRTLKVGKSIKINAKVVLPKDKKCRWHTAKIRCLVSDTKVVSVSTKGKIMAKSVGEATVYAIAQNGAMAKVKVIVKN